MTGIRNALAIVCAALVTVAASPALASPATGDRAALTTRNPAATSGITISKIHNAGAADAEIDVSAISTEVTLTLAESGLLHVSEKISGAAGDVRRTFLTRTRLNDAKDRLYQISAVKGGTLSGDVLTTRGGTLSYDVLGTITPLGSVEEFRWFAVSGWDVPVAKATVKVTGPGMIQNLSCFAGDPASAIGCTAASMDHGGGTAEFEQNGLAAGQALTVVVGYPKGATGATPILESRFTLTGAFALTPVSLGSLALLLLLLLGGFALVYWTRGRDARAVGAASAFDPASGPFSPVSANSGPFSPLDAATGRFSPPDGVRPGQIGTLLDEQADVIDVTATIIDLAVRGYLLIDEQPRQTYDAPDWLLVRRPDAALAELLPYEQALHDAIFDGRDAVLLSQLSGSFATHLSKVRDALYTDVVRQGWFARRPDTVRGRWSTLGLALSVVGIAATVALAWYTSLGMIGLGLIIAGAALALGGRYMPAKTAKGSTALAHTLDFRRHLLTGEFSHVPEAQRVELYSRYLPYAVIFDGIDHWSRLVVSVTGDDSPADNLYWYQGPAEWDLSKFAASMRTFTTTASGAISASRQFRSL